MTDRLPSVWIQMRLYGKQERRLVKWYRKSKDWKVIRMGADIKIKCQGCGAVVMFPRHEFERKMKKVIERSEE